MIIDLPKFMKTERPCWTELNAMLKQLENEPNFQMSLDQLQRFQYLYERTSADLARIITFSSEPELKKFLENLVARAYGEIHETRGKQHRLAPLHWFFHQLPQTFRRHLNVFWLTCAITLAGSLLGGFAVSLDQDAKRAILPARFAGHLNDPNERVAQEEKTESDRLAGVKGQFSASLMRNNISVAIKCLALGMTYGIGTVLVLFYNGVILGLITVDYIMAGQTQFLLAWLLPHGVIEIPAILIGGQAGLILAQALIGWGERTSLANRLRTIAPDLVTLIMGVALMLVWAGLVEAFLSQYHEPAIPYPFKIAFGTVELILLILFLSRAGTGTQITKGKSHKIPNLNVHDAN